MKIGHLVFEFDPAHTVELEVIARRMVADYPPVMLPPPLVAERGYHMVRSYRGYRYETGRS